MNLDLRKQNNINPNQGKRQSVEKKRMVLAIAMGALLMLLSLSSTNFVMHPSLAFPVIPEALAQDQEAEEGEGNEQDEVLEGEEENNLEDNLQGLQAKELGEEAEASEERPAEVNTVLPQQQQREEPATEENENTNSPSLQEAAAVDDDSKRTTALSYLESKDFGHHLGYEAGSRETGWEWGTTQPKPEEEPDPASPRLEEVTEDVKDGNQALKATVYPYDKFNDGARAEVVHWDRQNNDYHFFEENDEVYYRWYTKIPIDFPMKSETWHIITQWHQRADGNNCNPPTNPGCRGVPLTFNLRDDDKDGNPTLQLLVINRVDYFDTLWTYELNPEDRNTWHEFLLHIKWSGCDNYDPNDQCTLEDDGAFLEFWFKGKKQVLEMPATFYNMDKDNLVYMKQGMYHCDLASDCPYVSSDPPLTVYHDGMEYLECKDIPDSNQNKGIICEVQAPPETPPVLTVPDHIEVKSPTIDEGTRVTYEVTAEDTVDGTVTLKEDGKTIIQDSKGGDIALSCNPASGSQFPVGETTTVQCSATDAAGNIGTASFTVKVSYDCANAQNDIEAINRDIEYWSSELHQATGSQKAVIVKQIEALQEDREKIEKECNIPPDVKSPFLTVPEDIVVEDTTGNGGAQVTFTVTAEDNVDGTATLKEDGTISQGDDIGGSIMISCNPASGSQFPVGETTTVQCSATDAAGNIGTASFTVRVNSPGECANAPERIAEIDSEIESLRVEQEDAPKTLKGAIAKQIRELEEERAELKSRCGL